MTADQHDDAHPLRMIEHGKTILSSEIAEEHFVCNLAKCKGACCVEGEGGAPLDDDELAVLEREYPNFKDYVSPLGQQEVARQGLYYQEDDGEFAVPTLEGRECVFATYNEQGHLQCGIERAWLEGKTTFRKPISCQLYPIRITKYEQFEALNYHRWDICAPACEHGASLGVPLYKFLKAPLIRRYGQAWYDELVRLIEEGKA